MIMKQEKNPYPYSDNNKRYLTFDYFTKHTYGRKCAKLPIDLGLGCPNIDGTLGSGGCIYCSGRGAGDFAAPPTLPVRDQLDTAASLIRGKWGDVGYIPYFQAHSNTYGDPRYLREKYFEAASYPGAVAVSIATRADCLSDAILSVLEELSSVTDVYVELGLQTASDRTAALINRCMTTGDFLRGYESLSQLPVRRCIHIINGLPGEDADQMLSTARFCASLNPDMMKIHMLYIIEGTAAAEMYRAGKISLPDRGEYVRITASQLTLLPPETVIGRLTGDAPGDSLIAPEWIRKKVCVLNEIDKYMYENRLWQGKEYR